MLFLLADNLSSLKPSEELRDAISNLLVSHREGSHMVVAPPSVCQSLMKVKGLGEREYSTIRKIGFDWAQSSSLLRQLKTIIEVHLEPNESVNVRDEGGRQIISCDLRCFTLSASLQPTILLAENLTDCVFYRVVLDRYFAVKGYRVCVRFQDRAGGGSTMHDSLRSVVDSRLLCLCLVDSDKKYPKSSIGSTAKKVMGVTRDIRDPRSYVLLLRCREAENLVPVRVFQKCLSRMSSSAVLERLEVIGRDYPEVYRFLDIKEGTRFSDELHAAWTELETIKSKYRLSDCGEKQCAKVGCRCWIHRGLGRDVLEHVVSFLKKASPREHLQPVELSSDWENYCEMLYAWGVAAPVLRT